MERIVTRTEHRLRDPHARSRHAGEVLCLHDGSHRQQSADRIHTLTALEHWLPRWRDLGLDFVTIDQAVRAPAP
jgi:hypothetical protein